LAVQLVHRPAAAGAAGGWSLVYSHELQSGSGDDGDHANGSNGDSDDDGFASSGGGGGGGGSDDGGGGDGESYGTLPGYIAIEVPLVAHSADDDGAPPAPAPAPHAVSVHLLGAARRLPPHQARAATRSLVRLWAAHAAAHLAPARAISAHTSGGDEEGDATAAAAPAQLSAAAHAPPPPAHPPTPSSDPAAVFRGAPVWQGGPVAGDYAFVASTRSEAFQPPSQLRGLVAGVGDDDIAAAAGTAAPLSGGPSGWEVSIPGPGEAAGAGGALPARQPSVWVGRDLSRPARLISLGLAAPSDFSLFSGASVWAPGQLERECALGAWVVVRHADVGGLLARAQADAALTVAERGLEGTAPAAAVGAAAGAAVAGDAMWTSVMRSLGGEFAEGMAAVPRGAMAAAQAAAARQRRAEGGAGGPL
jgi:hypothetical protein